MTKTQRKKIFVLGPTGFIGSAVMDQFSENQDKYEVRALIHENIPYRKLECFNTFTGDLQSFDLGLLDGFQPDSIIHMARMSGKGKSGRTKEATKGAKANQRIIDHLMKGDKKPHVVYVSGTLVYGNCRDQPVDEDSPLNPTAFAGEYILAEKPWMDVLESKTLPVSIVRPPWIMGQNSWFKTFFLDFMAKHRKIPLWGPGENWLSILHVKDCAGLILHALEYSKPGEYYNLGIPDYFLKLKDFTHKISAFTGMEILPMDREEIIRIFDETVYEAFTFSLKSSTKHQGFIQGYRFNFPTVEEMIQQDVGKFIENLQNTNQWEKK